MQDSDIQAARRADRRRAGVYIVAFLAAVCVAVATILGLEPGDFSEYETRSRTSEEVAARPSSDTDGPSVTDTRESRPPPSSLDQSTEAASRGNAQPTAPEEAEAQQTLNTEERDEFKKALADFNDRFGDSLEALREPFWRPIQREGVLALRDESVSEFARGQYRTAKELLSNAQSDAEAYFAERSAALERAVATVEAALRVDDLPAARTGLETATSIDPEDPRLPHLQKEVDALPELLSLLAEAERARVEQRPRTELKAIEKALRLAPSRSDLAARSGELREAIKEEDFGVAIDQGLKSIDNRDLAAAESALEDAKKLYPDRAETAALRGEVDSLVRRLSFEGHIRAAQTAAQADDWVGSLASLNKALSIEPANKDALQSKQLAERIIGASNAISGLLENPDRLALDGVAGRGDAILRDAKTYASFSPELKAAADRLTRTLEAYQKDVQVFIISDGKTDIGVRGVGRVGKTMGRTIQLKPGAYVFEGAREGHISKIVELDIPPGVERVEVMVVSDERL